jgi:hypothetical protein
MCDDIVLLLDQYVSLINPNTSVYCGILRDGYEAFAMYCFGRYITACLGKLYQHTLRMTTNLLHSAATFDCGFTFSVMFSKGLFSANI